MEIESIEKSVRKGWTAFLYVILGLVIFGITFWVVFYSTNLANYQQVISLRNWYQETFWKAEGLFSKPKRDFPPFDPIYSIKVDSSTANQYSYSLWGTFSRVDVSKNTIYIRSKNGETYAFINANNVVGKMVNFPVVEVLKGNPFNPDSNLVAQIIDLPTNSSHAATGIFQIKWSDKRNLTQIINDHSANNNLPINSNFQNTSIFIFLYD